MTRKRSNLQLGDRVYVFPGLRKHSPEVRIRPTEICEVVELPRGPRLADAVAIRRARGEVVWVDVDMVGLSGGAKPNAEVAQEPLRRSSKAPVSPSLMRDSDFCQSLLIAVASATCRDAWAVAVIHPADVLLLWDSRPKASLAILEVAARNVGLVIDSSRIESGPHAAMIVGILVQPRRRELDAAAAELRGEYEGLVIANGIS